MSDLGRMLDMYRRRGFETLSDVERSVLSELVLGAVVDVQATCRDILEATRALNVLTVQVAALDEWKERVETSLDGLLSDKKAGKEGLRRLGWSIAEKAGFAILALLAAALVAYLLAAA